MSRITTIESAVWRRLHKGWGRNTKVVKTALMRDGRFGTADLGALRKARPAIDGLPAQLRLISQGQNLLPSWKSDQKTAADNLQDKAVIRVELPECSFDGTNFRHQSVSTERLWRGKTYRHWVEVAASNAGSQSLSGIQEGGKVD